MCAMADVKASACAISRQRMNDLKPAGTHLMTEHSTERLATATLLQWRACLVRRADSKKRSLG
jgi:hypothetical protein